MLKSAYKSSSSSARWWYKCSRLQAQANAIDNTPGNFAHLAVKWVKLKANHVQEAQDTPQGE